MTIPLPPCSHARIPTDPEPRRRFPASLSRRSFLLRAVGAFPAAAAFPAVSASLSEACTGGSSPELPGTDPLFTISLAEWSLHRALSAGTMDHLDFPQTAREDFGIGAVEYVNSFFRERTPAEEYLQDLRTRCEDHGVRSLLIMCDGEGAIGDPDPGSRAHTVENHIRWVEAARFLGCHSIRVNAQSEGTPEEQEDLVADGLRRLAELAAPYQINVIVENHGGLSSNGQWLAGVIRSVDHPRCGTLPDFGNFQVAEGDRYDPYLGVEEMMPYARAVSAKSHAFDERGQERDKDYLRLLRIVLASGYRGFVGIEYEGTELSEPDGIRATKALLERVRDDLRQEFS